MRLGPRSRARRASRGDRLLAVTAVAKTAEILALVGLVLVLPRILGPRDYGTLAVAMSVVALGSLALAAGGPTLMSSFLPRASEQERPALARALALRVARWRALGAVAIAAGATVAALVAPDDFASLTTVLVATALVLELATTLVFDILLGLGGVLLWSFRYAAQSVLLLVSAGSLGAAFGAQGALAGLAIGSAIMFVVGAAAALGPVRRAPSGHPIPPGALRFGATTTLAAVCVHSFQRGAPIAVAVLGASAVQAGFAGLAAGVALVGAYAVSQASVVQLPGLSARAVHDLSGAEAEGRALVLRIEALVIPCALVAAALAEPVLRVALGEAFAGAAPAFAPALAVLPLSPLLAFGAQVASLRLRAPARAMAGGAGLAAFLAVAAALVPADGARGATMALLAATAVTAGVYALVLPGAFDRRILLLGFGGAAATLAIGLSLG